MIRVLILWLALLAPVALTPVRAFAQDTAQQEADKGFITDLITSNLSGGGREVLIYGFAGALSSQATIQRLTVADATGVWLTLENVTLTWNRSALFGGRIEIDELSAAKITVARLPVSPSSAPAPEATPFKLPELPVAININTLHVDDIALGPEFLGEPVDFLLDGAINLAGGEGTAKITATRLGDKSGQFDVDASYSNATDILGLNLTLSEEADGITARLLNLPGRPSVRMVVQGTGPIPQYEATLTIATGGEERLAGSFKLTTSDAPADQPGAAPTRSYHMDVGGDVTTLFLPAYRDFFGPQVQLVVDAAQRPDGGLNLSQLNLSTASLRLQGDASIGAGGWPEGFRLTGDMGAADGTPVVLPIPGASTTLQKATVKVLFDAASGDSWSASVQAQDFSRPGLTIPELTLTGGGVILKSDTGGAGRFTADLTYAAKGLQLDDAGLSTALGDTIGGQIQIHHDENQPTVIDALTLTGPGIEVSGNATIQGPENRLATEFTLNLAAEALGRFSTLAGMPLGGSANLTLGGTVAPLDGTLDVAVQGSTTDLAIGNPKVDPLMRGKGAIAFDVARDTGGARITGLALNTDAVKATGNVILTSGAASANIDAALTDVSLVVPQLSGPATIKADATRDDGGAVNLTANGRVAGAVVELNATKPAGDGPVSLDLTANAPDLSSFAALAGRSLGGGTTAHVVGTVATDLQTYDLSIGATTQNLVTDIAQLDPLLRGQGTLKAQVSGDGPAYAVKELEVQTNALRLTANTQFTGTTLKAVQGDFDVSANVTNLGVIQPGLGGPASLTARGSTDATGRIDLVANARAAGGTIDLTVTAPDIAEPVTLSLKTDIPNLRPFGVLAGQNLSGALRGAIDGTARTDGSAFDLAVALRSSDLGIGNPTVDRLIGGSGQFDGQVSRTSGGGLTIRGLNIQTSQLSVTGSLSGNDGAGQAEFDARLRDVGLFAPDFSGPVTATGTAARNAAGNWTVNSDATGPGGTRASVRGQISAGGRLDLGITGQAPLGLVNGLVEPRRLSGTASFDLAVNGPPALTSVSGTIRTNDASLALPTLQQSLTGISGTVQLSAGRAQVALGGTGANGGRIDLSGPVGLSGGLDAALQISLVQVVLKDPTLYAATLNGQIGVNGPLAGGAAITGQITLGPVEVQVPSSGIGALGDLPEVTHVGTPQGVQQTLNRAGLSQSGAAAAGGGSGGGRRAYPLDLTITAPGRIFVRGRGLDAELGGTLKVTGTTANVIPSGQFTLIRGRLSILQQNFDLTEGTITLAGDFTPYLRLIATTTARTGTIVNIVVEGSVSEPTVTFSSAPDLPQDEVLSQLIFGRDLASISPLQAVQLAAAVGTLAGRGGGGIIDNFRQGLGLDDFQVTTDSTGNVAVQAGKYLSDNVYTDVTVNGDGTTDISINLDVTENITAKGSAGSDGDTSIGIFYEKDY